MGQAKNRGSFEQRRSQAIERSKVTITGRMPDTSRDLANMVQKQTNELRDANLSKEERGLRHKRRMMIAGAMGLAASSLIK